MLTALKELDGREDYRAYVPSADEKAQVIEVLGTLPAGMRRALQRRLIGIYFIENFMGNGLAGWVKGKDDEVYAWLVINPVGFSRTVSETLTLRDGSLFKGAPGLSVDAGRKYRGIVYTVLHEGTHAYDYIDRLTPYVDTTFAAAALGGKPLGSDWDVWARYGEPREGSSLPLRGKLKFYGLQGGPFLKSKDARPLYDALVNSPFASLYGSQNWAEDTADLVTFYHLTQVLKQPYRINLKVHGGTFVYEPMRPSSQALPRAQRLYERLR